MSTFRTVLAAVAALAALALSGVAATSAHARTPRPDGPSIVSTSTSVRPAGRPAGPRLVSHHAGIRPAHGFCWWSPAGAWAAPLARGGRTR